MDIRYVDRKTGQERIEKVYGQKALRLLYGDGFFREVFSSAVLPILVKIPLFSHLYGMLQKHSSSVKKVKPFIEAFEIDDSEFQSDSFVSFNDFFTRKLKEEKRPVVSDQKVLAMPADGRYLAYEHFEHFSIKGKEFSLKTFLGDEELAERYKEGSMVIIRLCPVDYHRFHFPCDGKASLPKLLNGFLYSVNPMALRKRLSILAENKRVLTELESVEFGKILYIEIGATSVGSIRQTFTPGFVHKGQEKGYFEFGGSCIVMLFEKDRIALDQDLLDNTKRGIETRANFGESLARSCK